MITVAQLEAHFKSVYDERMRDVPICNSKLAVEAVGFDDCDGDQFGILITPWFMNLVLLPGTDEWDACAQGENCTVRLPAGEHEFTVGHDDHLGTSLTASLFSTVADFPDQAMARDTAFEVLRLLRTPAPDPATTRPQISRRALLRGETAGA